MRTGTLNRIMGISESFQLPRKLMARLLDPKEREETLRNFMDSSEGESLDHDWFTGYFEEEHANKTKMAQDFTPVGLARLVGHTIGDAKVVADVCAGTGGLTIAYWSTHPDTQFQCYEFSERAVPLLLLNLALRNISADVVRCDLLTGVKFEAYRLTSGKEFSDIEEIPADTDLPKVDGVISNPPYSLKYDPDSDDRFPDIKDKLPKNYADYVFMAFALSIMKKGAKAGFILPHGVLFRANREREFRRWLVDENYIKAVIGLPGKLFINTSIPTCIITLDTKGVEEGVFFMDAKGKSKAVGKLNIIDDYLEEITAAYDNRKDIDRFCRVAHTSEIDYHDYNLNISRYVDATEPEEPVSIFECLAKLDAIDKQIHYATADLYEMTKELVFQDPDDAIVLDTVMQRMLKITDDGRDLYELLQDTSTY